MADYDLSFNSVSIPNNSGGITVTVEEDDDTDGTTETSETITLSDGTTSYSTSSGSFVGSGQVALSFTIGSGSDVTVTADSVLPVNVSLPVGNILDANSSGVLTTSNGVLTTK